MLAPALLAAITLAAQAAAGAAPARTEFAPVVRPAAPEDLVAPPAAEPPDFAKPPPGAPEDQALFLALRDDAGRSTIGLARVVQATHRIRYGRYYEELDRGAPPAEARRLRARLDGALVAARKAVPDRPRIFQCRHVLLDLEQRMDPAVPETRAELPTVRREAEDCARAMRALAAAVVPAADELDRTLAAIDAHLGRGAPAPPGGGGPSLPPERAAAALEAVRR